MRQNVGLMLYTDICADFAQSGDLIALIFPFQLHNKFYLAK